MTENVDARGPDAGLGDEVVSWLAGHLGPLVDHCGDGLVVAEGGRIVWANAALLALAGVEKPEDLLGQPIDGLWAGGAAGPLPTPGQPRGVETLLARREGEARAVWVEPLAPGAAALDHEGWLVRDLDRERHLAVEIHTLARELREARQESAALQERLERESGEREHLLGVVSHELRTPITVVSGYSRILLSGEVGPLNDEQRRFLDECEKSCRRLDRFVAELLGATKALRCGETLALEQAPVEVVVRAVVGFLRPLVEERGLEVELAFEPGLPPVRFDPSRLQQVLTNLLGNAIKYAEARVRLDARARSAGGVDFVEISVEDDGPGVPVEERERIFEPYVQGQRGSAGGLGLGLAICKRIVAAHGGAISVGEGGQGGSRFVFSLPVDGPGPGVGHEGDR